MLDLAGFAAHDGNDQLDRIYGTVIVGGGPAGLAPLLAAAKAGLLERLLEGGVAVIEAQARLGAGSLGGHGINSDSSADTFLTAIEGNIDPRLVALRVHPVTLALGGYRGGPAPLALAGEFLGLIGDVLAEMIAAAPNGLVLTGHEAVETRQRGDGVWMSRIRPVAGGPEQIVLSRTVVMAAGATQPPERLEMEQVCGEPLLPRHHARLMQSGDVLAAGGIAAVAERVRSAASPKIVIVGGSQSAMATAHALLHAQPAIPFGLGGVTVLHRRMLRVTYNSAAEALAEGYDEFTADDICPLSGRVFRLAGFRLESRELVMRGRGIGGRAPEPRLRLHQLQQGSDRVAAELLNDADLIIAALGYRPRGLPVFDAAGAPIALLGHALEMRPLVGAGCEVLDMQRRPIAGLFGIGLAAGFVPSGELGGERSFIGQANGLWVWQNAVGLLIARALLAAQDNAPGVAATAQDRRHVA